MVVNKKNEILLIQRAYGKQKGKWSLPGGQRDSGESLRKTAIRETYEETGIRMAIKYRYYKNKHGAEVWRGSYSGGHIRIQKKECLDAKWFKVNMLPDDENLAFGPDKRVISKWASESHGGRRVHYPMSKMDRAGFALVIFEGDILLVRSRSRSRRGKWTLPGGEAKRNESRSMAASRWTGEITGVHFEPFGLYYRNRHRAHVYYGRPVPGTLYTSKLPRNVTRESVRFFPIDELPDDDSLAFAIDVRAIEKWASENPGSVRLPC